MKRILDLYLRQLSKRPWTTQAVTTGFLFFAGDVIAQQAIERRGTSGHQWRRSAIMTGVGFCVAAPALRGWYMTLERIFPANVAMAPLKKMVLDQALFAPTFLAGFFGILGVLEGKSWQEIHGRYMNDYIPALKTNYMIWPGVQMLNFYIIPFQHRVTFVNVIALGWNSYLAWKAHT
eukprot:scpid79266/ scgid8935/ Protein Mpv17